MKAHLSKRKKTLFGFSLIEVLVTLAIISALVGIMANPMLGVIERSRLEAEEKNLNRIAEYIKSSFSSEDLENINISSLTNDVVGTVTTTGFDYQGASAGPLNVSVYNPADWFSRIGKMQGLSQDITGVKNLFENTYRGRRMLIVGPQEVDVQRYLLISVMLPDDTNLTIPNATDMGMTYANWFDGIFSNNWEFSAPPGWNAAWNASKRGIPNTARVKVVRISQPRLRIRLNVNVTDHNTREDGIYIYYNHNGSSDDLTIPQMAHEWNSANPTEKIPDPLNTSVLIDHPIIAHTGQYPSAALGQPGILAGRRVSIYHVVKHYGEGPPSTADISPGMGPKVTLLINQNTTVSIQND